MVGNRRIALLLACTSFLCFLVFQHGHFKGSDELAVFEMTESLYTRGDLAVPALRHTEVGADGRRYSYFSPGQSVLALPLFGAARLARGVLPEFWSQALAGPPNRRGAYRFGGELETTFVGLYAPIAASLLVALFFVFQRDLGVSARSAALLALLFAASTHTLVMSTYFLRHTSEAIAILGSLLLFRRFGATGSLATLAAGSAVACATFLIRVPAAIAGPVLAGYLAWLLHRRDDRRTAVLAAIGVPVAIALGLYLAINQAKWGAWIGSPMIDQQSRFNSSTLRGLAGLLLSPGSSVFVYSPLLLLAPAALGSLWRRDRALFWTTLALSVTWLLFYARFDGWSGLWSAPGPRYLYPLVPLWLLAVGPWLDAAPLRSRRWVLACGLAGIGLCVQIVSIVVRWGSVPNLAGYPALAPDQAEFLFQLGRSPVVVMAGLLASGGPFDSWLLNLWRGWDGFPGQPAAVVLLLVVWLAALVTCMLALRRLLRERVPT